MPNNVTELTQRLLRALDSNYNVIDMPEVVESISQLEKVAITIELLEATRLGKYVNELRRKTSNQELSRRAKDLLKKWRSMLPAVNNGQTSRPGSALRATNPSSKPPTPPGPPKLSPPVFEPKKVSPALQGRMLSPGGAVQKLVSPSGQQQIINTRLVSPQIQRRLVSPQTRLVSPGPRLNSQNSSSHHQQQHQLVSPKLAAQAQTQKVGEVSPPLTAVQDVNLNQLNRKRPIGDILERVNIKRSRMNGGITDLDISDSSNSSFKDIVGSAAAAALVNKPLSEDNNKQRDVIVINSDSNSSYSAERPGGEHTIIDQIMLPKRRGRKKGSKNHRNLLDEAETSFTNKLAVSASRGSSKVKTTQEILAGIQNKNNSSTLGGLITSKPSKEDLEEKAAKLTERVSIIDRKLNANAHRNKNSQKHKLALSVTKPNERVIESGSVINDKSLLERLKQEEAEEDEDDEDEVVVVDDNESADDHLDEKHETDDTNIAAATQEPIIKSLSEEEALALLPPIDRSVLLNDEIEFEEQPLCTCYLKENKQQSNDFSIGEDDDEDNNEQLPPFQFVEDPNCLANEHLTKKYNVHDTSEDKIQRLHETFLPNVNGNWSAGTPKPEPVIKDGFYINIVPHISERLDKDVRPLDSFKKYSVTEGTISKFLVSSDSVIEDKEAESEHLGDVNGNGGSDCSEVVENVEELKAKAVDSANSEKCDKNRTENNKQEVFREWYECIDTPSFNGETLRILPYCILD